jgi:hypothetical protein
MPRNGGRDGDAKIWRRCSHPADCCEKLRILRSLFEGERWTEKVIGRYGTKISLAAETESPGVGPPEMT